MLGAAPSGGVVGGRTFRVLSPWVSTYDADGKEFKERSLARVEVEPPSDRMGLFGARHADSRVGQTGCQGNKGQALPRNPTYKPSQQRTMPHFSTFLVADNIFSSNQLCVKIRPLPNEAGSRLITLTRTKRKPIDGNRPMNVPPLYTLAELKASIWVLQKEDLLPQVRGSVKRIAQQLEALEAQIKTDAWNEEIIAQCNRRRGGATS